MEMWRFRVFQKFSEHPMISYCSHQQQVVNQFYMAAFHHTLHIWWCYPVSGSATISSWWCRLWTNSMWLCFTTLCTSGLHSIRPSETQAMCWKVVFSTKATYGYLCTLNILVKLVALYVLTPSHMELHCFRCGVLLSWQCACCVAWPAGAAGIIHVNPFTWQAVRPWQLPGPAYSSQDRGVHIGHCICLVSILVC
jgi:hypothetical protein